MNEINLKSERFCHEILRLKIHRSRAAINLVMALASYEAAQSSTELSLSPVYHYQYSSICDALSDMAKDETSRNKVRHQLQSLCMGYFKPGVCKALPIVLQTDSSPIGKAHSPTLPGRTYIAVPNNVIRGNKPLDIGYEVSFVNLSDPSGKWSLPLHAQRVGIDQTASETALTQIGQLLKHPGLGLSDRLCLNTLDSSYGHAAYLAPSFAYDNLVSVVRLRGSMKVWTRQRGKNMGGAPGVYGEKFYLHAHSKTVTYMRHPRTGQPYEVFQRSVFELPAQDQVVLNSQTTKGRKVKIHLHRWNDVMIRTKDGHNMKDKPFDLLAIKVRDAQTDRPVFDRDMFVAISGKRKAEVSSLTGHQTYRRRYDIEPFLRFSKQRLLLDKYQTPVVGHFDNWLLCHQIAAWLLYTAKDEVDFQPRKWRKYLPQNQPGKCRGQLTIAQTRHAAQDLFLTFDQNPFIPRKSKKGRPRKVGETQIQRTRYEVVKKTPKKQRIKRKIQFKIE